MAKRELSSTLKNLKFMQRATQKDEKAEKEEEIMPAGDFPRSGALKRCVVIVEGDPHPAVTRGRMSFLSFNPSIDKLNEVASDPSETESAATSSGRQNEATPIRENGSSKHRLEVDGNDDLKRKQAELFTEEGYSDKSMKNDQVNQDSPTNSSSTPQKRHKREKLDWSVLRPPKYQNKKR